MGNFNNNVSCAYAETSTYSPSDIKWGGSQAKQSYTVDDFTFAASSGALYAELRVYNGTFTISSSESIIEQVDITCSANGTSKYGPGNFNLDKSSTGSYSYSGNKGTWTGDSSSLTLNASAQVRITNISITTKASKPSVLIDDNCLYQEIGVGGTFTMTATIKNAEDAKITWLSSDPSTIAIDEDTGVVTAYSASAVEVTASITVEGVTYTDSTILSAVYYEPEKETVTISELINDATPAGKKMFAVHGTIKAWGVEGNLESPNEYGDMIITDGLNDLIVNGCNTSITSFYWDKGNAVYTYTEKDGFTSNPYTCDLTLGSEVDLEGIKESNENGKVTINAIIIGKTINELTGISVTSNKSEYNLGDSVSFEDFSVVAEYSLTDNKNISSSKCSIEPEIFTTAGDEIEITISYTDISGTVSSTYNVKVNNVDVDLESLDLDQTELELTTEDVGTQLNLIKVPSYSNENITWESDNSSVAVVDQSGFVTPIGAGFALITATSNRTGKYVECLVEVTLLLKYGQDGTDIIDIEFTKIAKGQSGYNTFNNTGESGTLYYGKAYRSGDAVQLNGTSGGIWNVSSIGVCTSITTDCSSSTKNLQIYGSHTPLNEDSLNQINGLTLIGTLKGKGTIQLEGNYEYIYLKTDGSIQYSSITIKWESYVSTAVDMEALNDFIDTWINLSDAGDYDSINNKGTGKCVSEGWYDDAKYWFNYKLTHEQRRLFMENNYFVNYRERLLAWAIANNDTLDSLTNKLASRAIYGTNNFAIFDDENDSVILILAISMSAMSSIGILYICKKKKENN